MIDSLGRERLALLLILASALAGFITLASGMRDMEIEEGGILFKQADRPTVYDDGIEPPSTGVGEREGLSAGVIVVGLLVLFLLIFLAYRYREIRYGLFGALIFASMLLFLVYLYNQFAVPRDELSTEAQLITQAERSLKQLPAEPPQWVDGLSLLFTLGFFLIIALVNFWLYRFMRPKPQPSLAVIGDEAQTALIQLRSGRDLRDTIARCYYDMNQALVIQLGLRRPDGMTPREFEAILLEAGLPEEDIRGLTRLFEKVRYGSGPVHESDKEEAIRYLESIVTIAGQGRVKRQAAAHSPQSKARSAATQVS